MASIHKRPDSKYYHASYYDAAEKKWRMRSTKEATKKPAQAKADEWERQALGVAGLDDATQRAMAEVVQEARRLASLGRLNVDKGRELVERVVEIGTGGRYEGHTIASWLRSWQRDRAENVTKGMADAHTRTIERFLDHLGEQSEAPLLSLDEEHIKSFKRSLKGKKSTRNLELQHIRAALNAAVIEGKLSRNPARAVPKFTEDDSAEVLPFTLAEIKRLHDAAEGEWKGWILIAYYTGMRAGDCANLTWRSVDLMERLITVTTAKRKKQVRIPIHDRLHAYFESLPSTDHPSAYVLPELAKKTKANLSTRFKSKAPSCIMNRAGVSFTAFDGEIEGKRSFHSIRHSNITQLHDLGVPEEAIMAASAHSNKAVHANYRHSLREMREKISEVPSI